MEERSMKTAMTKNTIKIEVNSNFHHVCGQDLFAQTDARFAEYRRCWKEWPQTFSPGRFPLFLDVEVTSACNLKCEFCATTYRGNKIKRGFLSDKLFRKIIDEGAAKGLYGVKFNLRGEPLLHPQIAEFVRYAKQKGLIDVYFNTNALLLTDKMARDLISAGLDRLSISFEGFTKEIYERYRKGSSFEIVTANIENIQAVKRQLGADAPKIRVQTVMLPDIVPIFEDYKAFWKDKVDEVAFLDFKEMKDRRRGVVYPWACPQIWQRMAVWWDGTILPCNHDDDALLALGNVENISIEEAWNSDRLNKLRAAHKKGAAHEIPACD